jgi:hypothetical protein
MLLPQPFIYLLGAKAFIANVLNVLFYVSQAKLPDILLFRLDHFAKVTLTVQCSG